MIEEFTGKYEVSKNTLKCNECNLSNIEFHFYREIDTYNFLVVVVSCECGYCTTCKITDGRKI